MIIQNSKFKIQNWKKVIRIVLLFLTFNFALLTFNLSPAYAQTLDPSSWQTNSIGLRTTNLEASQKTAGLGIVVQLPGQTSWPSMQLQGGVRSTGPGSLLETLVGINLGTVKVPSLIPTNNTESSDWAHNTISINSGALNLTVSRLSPALLMQTNANSLRLFAGTPNLKYVAFHTASGYQVSPLSSTSMDLTGIDQNWILVWYGNNSNFSDTKKPPTYSVSHYPYNFFSLPSQYGYLADAPMLLTFQNNPAFIANSSEGGIDLTFSGSSGYSTVMPLFGRDHPAAITESWGVDGILSDSGSYSAITQINFWRTRLTNYPTTVRESYNYNSATDTVTITEEVTFAPIISGGIQFALLPPFLALAKDNLNVQFSGTVVDSNTPSEFGPIQGIENTNTYTWSIGGLRKYTDYKRVITNTGTSPADMTDDLINQVNRIVADGHYAPWMFLTHAPNDIYGGTLYWANPADTLYQLSELIPVLPSAQQTDLITYLRNEKTNYPPESVYNLFNANLSLIQGRWRTGYTTVVNSHLANWWANERRDTILSRVPLYSFFGTSRYYEVTEDSIPSSTITALNTALDNDMKEQDWATMYWFAGFGQHSLHQREAVINTNRHFAGLVGAVKLYKNTGSPNEALARGLFAKAAVVRIAQAVYPRYLYTANLADLNWGSSYGANWMGVQTGVVDAPYALIYNYNWTNPYDDARQILYLDQNRIFLYDHSGYTPDSSDWFDGTVSPDLIAFKDMVPEEARLLHDYAKQDVLIYLNKIKELFPYWYRSFIESTWGAEHALNHPTDAFQLFMAEALINKNTPQNLARFTSLPYLSSGDLFYTQKLAETIKAYQGWAWEDEDIGVGIPGDVNYDAQVNVLDIQACVNHILGMQDFGSRADVNNDSSVNVLDVQNIVNIILAHGA